MPLEFPIYLDYHATTPVDPRALEAMLPYFTKHFGNAASRSHAYGWEAEKAVDRARGQLAALVGASPGEMIFTSGATESNNLALKGLAASARGRGDHIITTVIEHKSVLDVCKQLEKDGWRVTHLPVSSDGRVDPDAVRQAITPRTVVVSVMAANNEMGAIQPLAEIGAITRERGVLLHTDASQAAGKIPLNVRTLNVDLMSLTGHKMYGPKGVGALFIRRGSPRIELTPLLHGGGHERGIRSGTLNVPGIVGFGRAAEINAAEMPAESARLAALRDRLFEGLSSRLSGVGLNGPREGRLPHNLNVHFTGVEGESILMAIDDIALSSGSACSSGTIEPSYVLKALGLSDTLALASLRFGLGRFTTQEEVDYAVEKVAKVITQLRDRRAAARGGRQASTSVTSSPLVT
ncbi:MAG TPA: IscS subfamily cysteine desulfurase [Vicinamibacterales bacterium]|nr:IscS subfamily cysteine desulfurase [Vicinamibacterales bacterium]